MKLSETPLNSAVITSTYVTQDRMPILYVSYGDDGEGGAIWQFHCGNNDYDMEKMQLVSLKTILSYDADIINIPDVPINYCAKRDTVSTVWRVEEDRN